MSEPVVEVEVNEKLSCHDGLNALYLAKLPGEVCRENILSIEARTPYSYPGFGFSVFLASIARDRGCYFLPPLVSCK